MVDLNREFHGLYVTAADNAAFAGSLRTVTHAAVVRQNFQDYAAAALARSLDHHLEMVAATAAGEPEWAAAVMRSHLHNARTTMLGEAA
jgi:DNA-binding GntR family transcriptional regulator